MGRSPQCVPCACAAPTGVPRGAVWGVCPSSLAPAGPRASGTSQRTALAPVGSGEPLSPALLYTNRDRWGCAGLSARPSGTHARRAPRSPVGAGPEQLPLVVQANYVRWYGSLLASLTLRAALRASAASPCGPTLCTVDRAQARPWVLRPLVRGSRSDTMRCSLVLARSFHSRALR